MSCFIKKINIARPITQLIDLIRHDFWMCFSMQCKPYWKKNQGYKVEVMELLKENPNLILSIKDVSEKIGCSVDCAKNILLELTAERKIVAFKLRRMWAFHHPDLKITTIEISKAELKMEPSEVEEVQETEEVF